MQHHEHFDGKGYPSGLSGHDICIGARILAVADVYDALTSDRPYRPGWEKDRAVAYINDGAGSQFDPVVVGAFLKYIKERQKEQVTTSLTLQGNQNGSLLRNETHEKVYVLLGFFVILAFIIIVP